RKTPDRSRPPSGRRCASAPLVDLERADQRQAEKFLVEHPRLFGVAEAIRVVVQAVNLGHVSLQCLVVQKKILTFLADNTFWSSTSLRRAIFQAPSTRRNTSWRAPTKKSCSVSARLR